MRVLVLGGSGFIGRHVVAGLSRSGDFVPIAASRHPDPACGVEIRCVDATDAASIALSIAGAKAVVNCIAASPSNMLTATQLVCRAAGSRPIVHLSSMAVYGGTTGHVDETHVLAPVAGYGASKARSEELLRDHAAGGGQAINLRPGCVHGRGSEQWTARIARLLQAGRLGDLGPDGDGVCNLTAIDDLVAAVIAALRTPGLNGEAINISDPEPGTWNAYFKRLAIATGATPLAHVPNWQARAEKIFAYPLKAAEIAGRKIDLRTPDPISPTLFRLFRQRIILDHRKADRLLGFSRTDPELVLREAADWMLAERTHTLRP